MNSILKTYNIWLIRLTHHLRMLFETPPVRVVCRTIKCGDRVWMNHEREFCLVHWSGTKGWVLETAKAGRFKQALYRNIEADWERLKTRAYGPMSELVLPAPGELSMMQMVPLPTPPTPQLVLTALGCFGWAGFMLVMLWLLSLYPTVAGVNMSPVGDIFIFSFSSLCSLGLAAVCTHYLNLFPDNENKLS